jgi:hypothetical protein
MFFQPFNRNKIFHCPKLTGALAPFSYLLITECYNIGAILQEQMSSEYSLNCDSFTKENYFKMSTFSFRCARQ